MFLERIETMPIPERVFELCRITADGTAPLADIREKIEPAIINEGSQGYFGAVQKAAEELRLIRVTEQGLLEYCGDKKILKKIELFRRYCNSVLYTDMETPFYQMAACFLQSDLAWLRYSSLTSEDVMDDIRKKTTLSKVIADDLRGMRFWMSFLGFGYVFEKGSIVFLPNMYTALKDFLHFAKLEKDREYTMGEFCNIIKPYANVALHNIDKTHSFCYAISAALRMMHDEKEIELRRNADSEVIWNLYRQEDHMFISEVTHIVLRKEV